MPAARPGEDLLPALLAAGCVLTWQGERFFYVSSFIFLKDFIYLFMRYTEKEREAETQAEGEAGSMQGTRRGTRSQVSRIMPWAEGGA